MLKKVSLSLLFLTPYCLSSCSAEVTDPMQAYGTTASNVFFYYEDVEAATDFYRDVLGLRVAADYGFAKIMQVAPKSFITLVDHTKGMHSADEPKTTAIAMVTDQLDEWWEKLSPDMDANVFKEFYTFSEDILFSYISNA